jgi:hypothetical protein
VIEDPPVLDGADQASVIDVGVFAVTTGAAGAVGAVAASAVVENVTTDVTATAMPLMTFKNLRTC